MNYLGHIYTARSDPDTWVGVLLGDVVKGLPDPHLPTRWRRGIRWHRRIDGFTDRHPAFLSSRQRLRPVAGRYAGVIVDLVYDHFLARDWDLYHHAPLAVVSAAVYRALTMRLNGVPESGRMRFEYLVKRDLLQAYRRLDALDDVLAGMERRLKRPFPLRQSLAAVTALYPALEDDFHVFIDDLRRYVAHARVIGADNEEA